MTDARSRNRSRGLFGVLAVSVIALLAGPPSIAAAETKVETVPAEVVADWKFNPTNPLQCGAVAFVRWNDPRLKGWETAVAWEVFYTDRGEEVSVTATPPFHDRIDHVGAVYEDGGSPWTHWWSISWTSRVGAGTDVKGCSDSEEAMLARYGSPARVKITIEVGPDPAACTTARKEVKKIGKRMGQLQQSIRKLKKQNPRHSSLPKLRTKLDKVENRHARAKSEANAICRGILP